MTDSITIEQLAKKRNDLSSEFVEWCKNLKINGKLTKSGHPTSEDSYENEPCVEYGDNTFIFLKNTNHETVFNEYFTKLTHILMQINTNHRKTYSCLNYKNSLDKIEVSINEKITKLKTTMYHIYLIGDINLFGINKFEEKLFYDIIEDICILLE